MHQQDISFDLSASIRKAVETARAGSGLLRVNDAAQFIILEHGLSELQRSEIMDALCHQCIRCGVSIEFQPQASDTQPA